MDTDGHGFEFNIFTPGNGFTRITPINAKEKAELTASDLKWRKQKAKNKISNKKAES